MDDANLGTRLMGAHQQPSTSLTPHRTLLCGLGGGLCVGLLMGAAVPSALIGGKPVSEFRATALNGGILPDCGVPPEYCNDPPAKQTIRKMDSVLMTRNGQLDWDSFHRIMRPFWTEDFEYVTGAFNSTRGLRQWYDTEYLSWNAHFPRAIFTQMIFLGEERTATTTTYGLTRWSGLFKGIAEPGTPIVTRITDFYEMDEENRIAYNYMMIDWADVFRQLGRPVLPPVVGRPEGKVLPPAAMYGVPAPASQFADSSAAEQGRVLVRTILEQDFVHQTPAEHLWHSSLTYYGPVGLGLASGYGEYREHILEAIYRGFGNTSLNLRILTCEDHFCGAHGRLHGVHHGDFLGFPASGKEVSLRFGMHWRILDGRAIEGWAILDMPDFFNQFGMDMFEVAASQIPGTVLHEPASHY